MVSTKMAIIQLNLKKRQFFKEKTSIFFVVFLGILGCKSLKSKLMGHKRITCFFAFFAVTNAVSVLTYPASTCP